LTKVSSTAASLGLYWAITSSSPIFSRLERFAHFLNSWSRMDAPAGDKRKTGALAIDDAPTCIAQAWVDANYSNPLEGSFPQFSIKDTAGDQSGDLLISLIAP